MVNIVQVQLTAGVPTGPAGASTVSTLDNLIGVAGTASPQVLTVQGILSGTPVPVSIASVPSHPVTNAGTFAVQAVLGAETTKVLGTINISAAQTVGIVAGTALVGKVGIDQTTDGTTNAVHLLAGTAIVGKFGIDQTTDGTTNLVRLAAETTKVIGTVRLDDGSGNVLSSTAGVLNVNISSGVNSNGSAVELNSAPVVIASNQQPVAVKGATANNADAVATGTTSQEVIGYGYGFNGTTWDRLQVDASKNLKVTFGASAAGIGKLEDSASADADGGIPAMYIRSTAVPANTSGTDGDYEMGRIKDGRIYVRGEPRFFGATAAIFSTLNRPANQTLYSANDSISDNATASLVSALSCSPSDTNDDPICITEVIVDTNDTALAAGVQIRAWLYNADPTASTGVGGGDNAAFSNKRNGFIGSCSGSFRAFSDGGKARLVPDEGSYIVSVPTSGAKTIYIQYQTLGGFTPSAVSTTLTGTARGFQGRA